MKKSIICVLALCGALVVCLIALSTSPSTQQNNTNKGAELTLYCAAGLRKPVSQIIEAYTAETGRKVNVIYNGSGALLSQIKIGKGDLYMPADLSYIEEAAKGGLTAESIPTAYLTAVIVVHKDNTTIRSLEDITKSGVRISLADQSAAVGKFTRKVLAENGLLNAIEKNVTVTKPTVNGIVEDVSIGSVDATIAWDAVARNFTDLRTIEVPIFSAKRRSAAVAVLNSTRKPTAALHLARYISAKDKGGEVFKRNGFDTPEKADQWAEIPQILVFSGSMLKPAIGERIQEFEQREGCTITTVYEGCGTLISQMKAGAKPSFYFSCDQSFLDQVQDRFNTGTVATTNEIVMLVPKGNTKSIRSLDDLLVKSAKVGVAHPVKSALGKLTEILLENTKLLKPLKDSGNIVVYASKGDELVTQMQAGSLDVALLYRSNALASPSILKYCDIVALDHPEAVASQPFASSLDTPYPNQLNRLGDFLTNAEGKKNFLKYGFTWEKAPN